jgi:hypothetical protein
MKKGFVFGAFGIFTFFWPISVRAQWIRTQVQDPMNGKSSSRFVLEGRFAEGFHPRVEVHAPAIILECRPGEFKEHNGGWKSLKANGKLIKGYFSVGAVVDDNGATVLGEKKILGSFRRDEEKPHDDSLSVSRSWDAVFFEDVQLRNYVYGHMLPTSKVKEHPQTKVLRVAFDEYVGGKVVMEFDLGDASDVADACGLTVQ